MDAEELTWNRKGQLGPGQRREIAAQLGAWLARPEYDGWRRDLADGRVVTFEGEVVFDFQAIRDERSADAPRPGRLEPVQAAYFAVAPRQAPALLAPWLGLPPGPYRLYLAPHARTVVGAEPMASPEVYQTNLHAVLRGAQDLTEATLAANRSGRMSAEQSAALAARRGTDAAFASRLGCAGVFFLLLAIGGALLDGLSGPSSAGRAARWPALLAVAGGAFALAIVAAVHRRFARAAEADDAREGRAVAVEGPCTKQLVIRHHGRIERSLRMHDRSFDVSHQGELFAAVVEGPIYRAYAAPRSGRLLAIEPARVQLSLGSG
ncbi:hypothetical protein [Sorangium sp. So ce204]|uniref:hypothetical protein n=1 Tax=Sorangium sp. So ce204 TaxID=3133288 RepID=UPI003F62D182